MSEPELIATSSPLPDAPQRDRGSTRRRPGKALPALARVAFAQYTIVWILIAFAIVVALTNEHFATPDNVRAVLRQASFTGIVAAAMTLLIMSEAFDLSVGSMLGVCSITTATLVSEVGIPLALAGAVAAGAVLGAVNGSIVTKLKIPTLVATLGTLYVFLSLGFIWTGGNIRVVTDADFLSLGLRNTLGVPLPFVVMVPVYLTCFALLRYTSYGRLVRAIGTNERAARFAGVPVARVRLATFALVGCCVGLAAFLQTAQLSSATPTVGTGFELTVIAIVVLGGTSLSGGRGTLLGTFCAALFFAALNNALNLYGVSSYWSYVAVGAVLITALAIDALRARLLGRS
jgi:ribose/xylose/arabinose/galactoside ABC-type transport system permease subunit